MGDPAAIDPSTLIVFCCVVGAFAATILGAVLKYHYDRRKLKRQSYNPAAVASQKSSSGTNGLPNATEMVYVKSKKSKTPQEDSNV